MLPNVEQLFLGLRKIEHAQFEVNKLNAFCLWLKKHKFNCVNIDFSNDGRIISINE